jgi:hypothetical protein
MTVEAAAAINLGRWLVAAASQRANEYVRGLNRDCAILRTEFWLGGLIILPR